MGVYKINTDRKHSNPTESLHNRRGSKKISFGELENMEGSHKEKSEDIEGESKKSEKKI